MPREVGGRDDRRRQQFFLVGIGVEPGPEPVGDQLADVGGDDARRLVLAGQRMPVGDEEEAVVLLLEAHPVEERTVQVPEVQAPGGAGATQHAFALWFGHR